MERIAIVGTGLIGCSIALALRAAGFAGTIDGVDRSEEELAAARQWGGWGRTVAPGEECWGLLRAADVVVLAVPVLAIVEWMERLAPEMRAGQLVTDVGSTKALIARKAVELFGGVGRAEFLPGHPMAGRESGGAGMGDGGLFQGATWLFTPVAGETERTGEWREWVRRMGAHTEDLEPERHDEVCAWVSHLPQMVATALSSLLEERFGDDPVVGAVGGRAIREMTRLGASPFSMWRDIAMTNQEPIARVMQALEQQMAHLRENLLGPELREMFRSANRLPLRREQVPPPPPPMIEAKSPQ